MFQALQSRKQDKSLISAVPSLRQIQNFKEHVNKSKSFKITTNGIFSNWCKHYFCNSKSSFDAIIANDGIIVLDFWETGCIFSSKTLLLSISGMSHVLDQITTYTSLKQMQIPLNTKGLLCQLMEPISLSIMVMF